VRATGPAGALTDRLAQWLAHRLDVDKVSLSEVRRHAEGYSWETFTFTADYADAGGMAHSLGLALRREPSQGPLEIYDAGREYRIYERVGRHSEVPVPEVLWLEEDPAVLDRRFYVMRRVTGSVPVPWAVREWPVFASDAGRRGLGRQFVEVLSAVHRIDTAAAGLEFLGRPATADAGAEAAIDTWERIYVESMFEEVLLMRVAFAWLRAHLATSDHVRLVHGDFRLGNFMLDEHDRINAIFDWELAHLGDPVFDIAWSALRLYRGRSPRFSRLLERDEYFALYSEQTGIVVEPEVFHFWTVLAYARALAQYFRACRAFGDGASDDLRLAAMAHQSLHLMKYLAEELGLR
jgi:aminoglycoside phosphotransferase (APT) family kinase protein